MPKRKHEDTDDSHSDVKEPLNGTISDSSNDEPERKRCRKSVNFEDVQVFYFNRTQGFVCVPSQGGTTLGMSDKHQSKEVYKLSEYLRQRKMLHRRRESMESNSCRLTSEHVDDDGTAEDDSLPDFSGMADENSCSTDRVDAKTNEEDGDNDEDEEISSNASIVPVPVRRRRMMLRLSGVRKIDAGERAECQEIRQSREFCGCSCQVFCDPDTCECSQDGIQCQVDRMRFPCGCTREGCGNKAGRIEFNPARVRTHFVHTIMRLELEKQLADAKSPSVAAAPSPHGRHIRFDDNGEPAQQQSTGEPLLFNSTWQGSCRECSQPSTGQPSLFSPDAADASYAATGRDDGLPMAACPWAASSPLYADDLPSVPATRTCSHSSGGPSLVSNDLHPQAASSSGGQVSQQTGHCIAWSCTGSCIAPPEQSRSSANSAGSAVVLDEPSGRAAPASDAAAADLPSSCRTAEALRCAVADLSYLEPVAELVLPPATLPCDPKHRSSPASWCCHCSAALPEGRCNAVAVAAPELPAIQEPATQPVTCQTLSNVCSSAEGTFTQYLSHALVDCGQQCNMDSTLAMSAAVSSLTPLTPCPGSSIGSNNLYLSFQLSTDEGLYTNTDPLLANYCHQGAYTAIASSHDSHVAASQELVPFTDLIESVYETVSA